MNRYFDHKAAVRIKRRERGRRWLGAMAWALAAALMLAGTLMAVHRYGLHRVRAIRVAGDSRQSNALEQALQPCLGRRLWDSGARGKVEVFLRCHPEVKQVEIRLLPWGTVWAKVKPRRPVARVDQGGMAIDLEGMVFPMSEDETQGLPLLQLAGSDQDGRRRAITALLAAGGCPASWTFDCSDPEDIKVMLPGPAIVRLGNGRFPDKWARLREILNEGEIPYSGTIDLRFHNQAVVRRQA